MLILKACNYSQASSDGDVRFTMLTELFVPFIYTCGSKIFLQGIPTFFSNGGGGATFCPQNITELQSLSAFKQMLAVCICFNKHYRYVTGSNQYWIQKDT